LPPRFKLLSARIVEPHSLTDEPGAIHLWVEALDEDNFPSGTLRACRLPYNSKLAKKTEVAIKASADGRPQGGRLRIFATAPAEWPRQRRARSRIPRSPRRAAAIRIGRSSRPAFAHGENESIVFAPLLPPRLPAKDAQ
jgi:hypothetical protein